MDFKLEICYVSTHRYAVSENTPFSTKALLICWSQHFFANKSSLFWKNGIFTQRNIVSTFTKAIVFMRAVLDISKFGFEF